LKKLKILITGGCGFVGSNLCIFLNNKNFTIFSLDNLSRRGSDFNLDILKKLKIKNFKYDISDKKKIKLLPRFDLIIDCCAEAAVEFSKKDVQKVVDTNLLGTINILEKIKKDKSKIIFMSTSRVNSIKDLNKIVNNKKILKNKIPVKKKINENFEVLKPKSIYGLTKLASEMFIQEYAYAFNIKYLINRCGVISGPLQFGKQDQGFISLWIWKHIQKKKISYIGFGGFGNQIRDVLHVSDLCELIYIQIKKFNTINNKLFTVGGSTKSFISLIDLTKKCQKITGNKLNIGKVARTSIYDIPYFISDNSLVKATYNWSPKKNINQIISDSFKWLNDNKLIIKEYLD
jgi:CDP-paratose 2-epimerase